MNINSYKATEMIMDALNTLFLLTATIIKKIHVSVVYLSVHLSVRLYVTFLCLWRIFQTPDSILRLFHKTEHLCG